MNKLKEMKVDTGKKNECPTEKEHGHKKPYLAWVHQADGTCYWKCEMCGWIMLDEEKKIDTIAENAINQSLVEWIRNRLGLISRDQIEESIINLQKNTHLLNKCLKQLKICLSKFKKIHKSSLSCNSYDINIACVGRIVEIEQFLINEGVNNAESIKL